MGRSREMRVCSVHETTHTQNTYMKSCVCSKPIYSYMYEASGAKCEICRFSLSSNDNSSSLSMYNVCMCLYTHKYTTLRIMSFNGLYTDNQTFLYRTRGLIIVYAELHTHSVSSMQNYTCMCVYDVHDQLSTSVFRVLSFYS